MAVKLGLRSEVATVSCRDEMLRRICTGKNCDRESHICDSFHGCDIIDGAQELLLLIIYWNYLDLILNNK